MHEEEGRTEVGNLPAVQEGKTVAEIRQEIRLMANLDAREWPDERLQMVAKTCTPEGTTAAELGYFLSVCTKYGLDPLVQEIWLAKDEQKGKMMILTGRDSYLSKAEDDPDYQGFEAGVVYENDEFEVARDGPEIIIRHVMAKDRGGRVLAYCVAYREGRRPALVRRYWADYSHLHGKKNWRTSPDDMLEARVITGAHKQLYRISGVYTKDEVDLSGLAVPEGMKMATGSAPSNGNAADATAARIEEMKAKVRQRDGVIDGGTLQAEPVKDPEPVKQEQAGPIEQQTVEFGKYGPGGKSLAKGMKECTWGWVLSSADGRAYVKHFILTDQYEHPSMTKAVRDSLAEALREATEHAGEAASPGSQVEAPEPSEGQETPLLEIWEECQTLAAALAKLGILDLDDAEGIDVLSEAEDRDGMLAMRAKLNAQLGEAMEAGEQAGLAL